MGCSFCFKHQILIPLSKLESNCCRLNLPQRTRELLLASGLLCPENVVKRQYSEQRPIRPFL
jgi:hypothetical protein